MPEPYPFSLKKDRAELFTNTIGCCFAGSSEPPEFLVGSDTGGA
jgi:hypothetical protein